MIACGLDFGTSNSAIGVMRDGVAELAPLEAGETLRLARALSLESVDRLC